MNTDSYISPGILELYVLDDLSREDRVAAEVVIDKLPELREEIKVIETGIEKFATANAVRPPARLKQKIFEKIGAAQNSDDPTPTISINKTWKYLAAASVSLAILAGSLAFYYRTLWQSTEVALSLALVEQAQLADNLNFTKYKLQSSENTIAIINNPDFQRVVLAGVNDTPNQLASVYWNKQTSETFLNIGNLSVLKAGQQYQLWGIEGDQPVDAGLIEATDGSIVIKMKNSRNPQTFAITIEPTGGSVSPTLDQMVVLGNV